MMNDECGMMNEKPWRYDTPPESKEVLVFGHCGHHVAYFEDGVWRDSWSGDILDRRNTKPWAWMELPKGCERP